MTGPEHYREAERLTDLATQPDSMSPDRRILRSGDNSEVLALAQVHATLALADFFRAWTEAQS